MLTGNLQFGKKWLIIDACSNYEVMQKMGMKVFYINLSNCRTKEAILEQMVLLYTMVAPSNQPLPANYDENITNKIVVLKQVLIKLLNRFEQCLLILCNVVTVDALDSFRLQCKIVVTTRDKLIQDELPTDARRVIQIDRGLTSDESHELLSKVLKQTQLPSEAMEIHELCIGNPCLVSMIASNLRGYPTSWKTWVTTLKQNECVFVYSLYTVIVFD